jgi:uncharacterized cupredoxin-like copper-binding protein
MGRHLRAVRPRRGRRHRLTVAAAAALGGVLVLGVAACGSDRAAKGTKAKPRAVALVMVDNDFSEPIIRVSAGETVTFTFRNNGKVVHEGFVGPVAAQAARGTASESGPEPAGGVLVRPGEAGTLTYTFGGAGQLILGCHLPGHYEAGMRSTINVT